MELQEQLKIIIEHIKKNNIENEEKQQIKEFLNWISKKEKNDFKKEINIILKLLWLENNTNSNNIKEKSDFKDEQIINNILWIKKQDIENLKNKIENKKELEIMINNERKKTTKELDDLIMLSYLLVFTQWYTDVHYEITWTWDVILRWRKNQLLETITLWDIYNSFQLFKENLYYNFQIEKENNKEEHFEKIILNFLTIIAEIWLGYKTKNKKELLEIKISTLWKDEKYKENLATLFKSLNLMIWNSNQSIWTYDVKIWLKFWKENYDYRLNFTPYLWSDIKFRITWRRLVTKIIDISYWSYDNIVKWNASWNWVFIIWWKTNSWKSTSIFWLLNYIHKIEWNKKIISIEDPVEKQFDYIEQLEIKETWNKKTDLDFNKYISALVRKDWNYVFIWEIRDKDSLSWIINLANIWYWIFTTTHISNIFWLKTRVKEMEWNLLWLLNSTKSIIVQQLIPVYEEVFLIKDIKKYYKKEEDIIIPFEKELYNYIKDWKIWNNMEDFYDLVKQYKITLDNNIIYKNSEIKEEKDNYKQLLKILKDINTFYKFLSENYYLKKENSKTIWMNLTFEVITFTNQNRKLYLENEEELIKTEKKYIPIFLNSLITTKNKKVNFLDIVWLSKWF